MGIPKAKVGKNGKLTSSHFIFDTFLKIPLKDNPILANAIPRVFPHFRRRRSDLSPK
jgi:hypothetical protein